MTSPVATQSYTQATGSASNSVFITMFMNRAPTIYDINYPVTKRWVNTATFKEYILTGFNTISGVSQAIWINLTNGTVGALDELSGNSGTNPVLPDSNQNINIIGDSTSINIDGSTNTLTANVILPSFPDVVLIGQTNSISSVTNGSEGQVLTSHTSGPPTFEDSSSELQLAPFGSTPNADGASISTGILTLQPADATNPGGISSSGTQVLGGIKSFAVSPILPLTGILLGNGATALTATSITENAALVAGSGNNIVSISLNDGEFVIGNTLGTPAAGTITAGSGISVTPSANGITISSTATDFSWSSKNSNFNALAGNGYFISGGNINAQLPTNPGLGDRISFITEGDFTNTITIIANSGQNILVGNNGITVYTRLQSQNSGASVTLISGEGSPNNNWYSLGAPQGGSWTLTN